MGVEAIRQKFKQGQEVVWLRPGFVAITDRLVIFCENGYRVHLNRHHDDYDVEVIAGAR